MIRCLGVALLIAGGETSELPSFHDRLTSLGATPCDFDPEFLCETIDVPVDHTAAGGPTSGTPGDVRCDAGLIDRYVPLSFAAAPHVPRRRPQYRR